MANEYKYLAFDAQYYLRRNWSVIKNNEGFNKYELISSFLWTLIKTYKAHPADKILLLFDKRPYKKQQVINEYKADRKLVLEEVETLKDKLLKAQTDEERAAIQKQLDEEEREAKLFMEMGAAKYEILSNFHKFGLVSLNIPGYEADDLARLLSLIATERKEKILLVSGDSDWNCMITPYTDVWRNRSKNAEFSNFSTRPEQDAPLDPFHMYQARDIYYGGHNNVVLSPEYKDYPFEDIIDSIAKKDDRFPEFKKYFEALNSDNYLDEIKGRLLRAMLNEGAWDKMEWLDYHDTHNLTIFPYYYVKFINMINRDLYRDQSDE